MSDPGAVGKMVEEVYADLHRIAEGYVRHERAKSVQATDLIHEAYLRLARNAPPQWQNRSHFVAIAAIAMRRLLVERARARHAAKRGGVQVQVTLNETVLVDEAATTAIDSDRAGSGAG
jgi:RNA polymerase sigma factor (TIGR02999 family)